MSNYQKLGKKIPVLLSLVLGVFMITACTNKEEVKPYEGKKVFWIDSYHEGYVWSDGLKEGIEEVFQDTGVELKIFRMDTKNKKAEEQIKKIALDVKAEIEAFNPDVVISTDDNAFKYVIMPYYKNVELPVVFGGINWKVSTYNAPYNNTAGMIEMGQEGALIHYLSEYTEKDSIGWLAGDTLTSKKEAENFTEYSGTTMVERYANTFEEWKDEFNKLQEEVGMIILYNNGGIEGWNDEDAKEFAVNNTKIPTGGGTAWMKDYTTMSITGVPNEHGEYTARTALKIMDGTKPSEITLTTNKKNFLTVHEKITEKLGIEFDHDILNNAEIVK